MQASRTLAAFPYWLITIDSSFGYRLLANYWLALSHPLGSFLTLS